MSQLPALLRDLERRWTKIGCIPAGAFRSGLEAEQVIATLEATGYTAPLEVIEWFEWHNGSQGMTNLIMAPSGFSPVSLDEGVTLSRRMLEAAPVAEEAFPPDAPRYWEPYWLVIATGLNGFLVADLGARDSDESVAVWMHDTWRENFRTQEAASLSEVVQIWQSVLDSGAWTWDPERSVGVVDRSSLPAEIQDSGLI